jgi:hypothetical protein
MAVPRARPHPRTTSLDEPIRSATAGNPRTTSLDEPIRSAAAGNQCHPSVQLLRRGHPSSSENIADEVTDQRVADGSRAAAEGKTLSGACGCCGNNRIGHRSPPAPPLATPSVEVWCVAARLYRRPPGPAKVLRSGMKRPRRECFDVHNIKATTVSRHFSLPALASSESTCSVPHSPQNSEHVLQLHYQLSMHHAGHTQHVFFPLTNRHRYQPAASQMIHQGRR